MGNTQALTDKPVARETVYDENGQPVAVHLSDVVTDPESADAVQIPDADEYPSANATERNDFAQYGQTSPADALDPDDANVNEVQRIDPTGTVSGGTFDTVLLPGHDYEVTLTAVPFDATPTAVNTLIDAELGDRATNSEDVRAITASGAAVGSGNLDFTFDGELAATNLPELTVDDTDITGGGSLAAATVTAGVRADA